MSPSLPSHHTIVVGLSFGDEGKGAAIDHLAERDGYHHVVRYNGGPQAAHHVVTTSGRVHCFAQLGAASMRPGRHTFLSRFMVVEPLALSRELTTLRALSLEDVASRLVIDRRATLLTPYHRALNRLQESARESAGRHGSCGMGVGLAWLDRQHKRAPFIQVGALDAPLSELVHRLEQVRLVQRDRAEQLLHDHPALARHEELVTLRDASLSHTLATTYRQILTQTRLTLDDGARLHDALRAHGVLFEGAQGVLLDAERGFFPHVTATQTTPANAFTLLDEAGSDRPTYTLGLLRAYATRHGAGPFPTESEALHRALPEAHNAHGEWQGAWRAGWLDEVLLRYALECCPHGIDALGISCLDRLSGLPEVLSATSYAIDSRQITRLPCPPLAGNQTPLTELLFAARPIYTSHAGWPALHPELPLHANARAFVERLGALLHLPVDHVAIGPTSAHRIAWHPHLHDDWSAPQG